MYGAFPVVSIATLQYVQTLEARLREAAVKNTTLLQENESLRKKVVQLESEVS